VLRSEKTIFLIGKGFNAHPRLEILGEFFSCKNTGKNLTPLVQSTRADHSERSTAAVVTHEVVDNLAL
jgi:hypothetical protein